MREPPKCVVCNGLTRTIRDNLCVSCCASYDRARRRDATTLGIIRWAAGRARRAERAAQRRPKGDPHA